MDNLKRFTFRIPTELFEKIDQLAKDSHRSVNSQIIFALEQYLKSIEVSPDSKDD